MIFDLLVSGGLQNVDDYKLHGGVAISISGGDGKIRKYVAGNKHSVTLRSKVLEWGTFKDMYKNELDEAGIKVLCDTANLIMDGRKSLNIEDTLEILRAMYKLDDNHLFRVMARRLDFGEFTKTALKSLFKNWAGYVEKLVVQYIEVRNTYIEKNKSGDVPNDMDALAKNWRAIDQYYGIDSSAPVLLYSHFPDRPYNLPWLRGEFVDEDVWDIIPEKVHWDVAGTPATTSFWKALSKSGFVYLGFCPKAPKVRLLSLFKFPVDDLLEAIKALGGSPASPISLAELSSMVCGGPKPDANFIIPEIARGVEPDLDNVAKVKWYLDQFVQMYVASKPHFEKIEKYYTGLAEFLGSVSIKLDKL